MNSTHPYFPASTALYKVFGDFVNTKMLTNPIGNVKDAIASGNLADAGHILAGGPKGVAPSVLKGYGTVTFDPTKEYSYGRGFVTPESKQAAQLQASEQAQAKVQAKTQAKAKARTILLGNVTSTGAGTPLSLR